MQAHVSLNPAIPLYLDVYITVHNINIDFGGGSGTTYGSATLITMLGYSGNAYSEVLNGSATSHSYVDVNSLKIRPDVPDLYHIEWTVTGLPYEDPDPPFPINPVVVAAETVVIRFVWSLRLLISIFLQTMVKFD